MGRAPSVATAPSPAAVTPMSLRTWRRAGRAGRRLRRPPRRRSSRAARWRRRRRTSRRPSRPTGSARTGPLLACCSPLVSGSAGDEPERGGGCALAHHGVHVRGAVAGVFAPVGGGDRPAVSGHRFFEGPVPFGASGAAPAFPVLACATAPAARTAPVG